MATSTFFLFSFSNLYILQLIIYKGLTSTTTVINLPLWMTTPCITTPDPQFPSTPTLAGRRTTGTTTTQATGWQR
jgi:hypothetical protein